ncbi:MAG: DUF6379 domain-containing protein [Clostridiales bacterium]|nr:DUF6379 domain-containing protein [Clostridiales bacterium]
MAFAMRVNYVDVICDDSLKNIFVNGKKMGCQFNIRLSYYRGHFLSIIDEVGVKIDGESIPQEDIRFCLRDKEFGLSELHDLVSEWWGILEEATIKVFRNGGFAAGEHDIDMKLMFRSPYMPISDTEYMPMDGSGEKRLTLAEF